MSRELPESFLSFNPWSGYVERDAFVNFLGAKGKSRYVTRVPQHGVSEAPSYYQQTNYPGLDEEYFEWIDLLETVLGAGPEFVMFELGAGFGRWSVNGALAAISLGKNYRILAIEPEPSHFNWLKENLSNNKLDLARCELVEAALSTREGDAEFYIGNPVDWYGQALRPDYRPNLTSEHKSQGVTFSRVKTITLNRFLQNYPKVDFMDMDVQGAELDTLRASKDMIDQNVARIHIGTHSHDVEKGLRNLFHDLGWSAKWDFPCSGESDTPYGRVSFQDGVQSWINPRFRVLVL